MIDNLFNRKFTTFGTLRSTDDGCERDTERPDVCVEGGFEAVNAALTPPGRQFELVLHPIPEPPPKSGVKAGDLAEEEEVIEPLEKKLKNRFELAWATLVSKAHPDGLWASAYHIKVAVRDGKSVWVSSGNWQSSNQPDVHPFAANPGKLPAGFQRKYNRDYHAIIVNDRLASIYETYIKRDFELASAQAAEPEPLEAPDLFVPEEEPEPAVAFAAPPQFFPPKRINRMVSVQPLLTPDNYAEHVLKFIGDVEKSVWFQNQYINFRGTNEDFAEFRLLVGALKKKIDEGREVRIICRDLMKQESLDILVAMGFPREAFRFQPCCHNKTIIVDGKKVMFGSHNWSNEGVKTNQSQNTWHRCLTTIGIGSLPGIRHRSGRVLRAPVRQRRRASSGCHFLPCSRIDASNYDSASWTSVMSRPGATNLGLIKMRSTHGASCCLHGAHIGEDLRLGMRADDQRGKMRVEELRRASSGFTFDPAPEFAAELRRLLRIDRVANNNGREPAAPRIFSGHRCGNPCFY